MSRPDGHFVDHIEQAGNLIGGSIVLLSGHFVLPVRRETRCEWSASDV
jgi:hypothetical protein